jgi:hypothetical protein
MILTLEDFEKDFFSWGGSMFVSERMRQAMALDEAQVRYYEIDDNRSAALVRSKNYMIMQPLLEDDVSDPEKSIYQMERFMPQAPLTPAYIRSIALRPDFEPDCELFYDSFFSTQLFCTDGLASRILGPAVRARRSRTQRALGTGTDSVGRGAASRKSSTG